MEMNYGAVIKNCEKGEKLREEWTRCGHLRLRGWTLGLKGFKNLNFEPLESLKNLKFLNLVSTPWLYISISVHPSLKYSKSSFKFNFCLHLITLSTLNSFKVSPASFMKLNNAHNASFECSCGVMPLFIYK